MYFRKVFDNTYIWNTPSLKKTRFKCYVLNNATKNWWGLRLLEFLFKRHYYLFTKYISLTFIYVYAHDVHLLSQYINYIYFKQVLFSQISYICILVWFDKIYIYIYWSSLSGKVAYTLSKALPYLPLSYWIGQSSLTRSLSLCHKNHVEWWAVWTASGSIWCSARYTT